MVMNEDPSLTKPECKTGQRLVQFGRISVVVVGREAQGWPTVCFTFSASSLYSVYPDKFSLWIQWILWIRRAREEPNVFTRLNVTLSFLLSLQKVGLCNITGEFLYVRLLFLDAWISMK